MRPFMLAAVLVVTTPALAQDAGGPPPGPGWKAEILAHLRGSLVDYKGVRDASVTKPAVRNMGRGLRWASCVRFNGRNRLGGYTGMQDYVAIWSAGKLSGVMDAFGTDCWQAKDFEPFKELEKL